MDLTTIVELINTLGLPSVIIACSFWYINRKDIIYQKELESWQEKDSQGDQRLVDLINATNNRNEAFQTALQDQTLAIRELVSELKGEKRVR